MTKSRADAEMAEKIISVQILSQERKIARLSVGKAH
jgi:hypothetical protein